MTPTYRSFCDKHTYPSDRELLVHDTPSEGTVCCIANCSNPATIVCMFDVASKPKPVRRPRNPNPRKKATR